MEPSRSLRAESTGPSSPRGTPAALAQTLTPHRLLTAEAKGLPFPSTWSWVSDSCPGPPARAEALGRPSPGTGAGGAGSLERKTLQPGRSLNLGASTAAPPSRLEGACPNLGNKPKSTEFRTNPSRRGDLNAGSEQSREQRRSIYLHPPAPVQL